MEGGFLYFAKSRILGQIITFSFATPDLINFAADLFDVGFEGVDKGLYLFEDDIIHHYSFLFDHLCNHCVVFVVDGLQLHGG